MIKFYIREWGDALLKVELTQSYGGAYRLYCIQKVEKVYYGDPDLATQLIGTHISGETFDKCIFNTFEGARGTLRNRTIQQCEELGKQITQLNIRLADLRSLEE